MGKRWHGYFPALLTPLTATVIRKPKRQLNIDAEGWLYTQPNDAKPSKNNALNP